MNAEELIETIRGRSRPLSPIATGVESKTQRLDVRAVLFDIYGTLLVSGSGDIGLTAEALREEALSATAAEHSLTLTMEAAEAVAVFEQAVAAAHSAQHAAGVEYPEVDILAVWRETLATIANSPLPGAQVERFALEFELRTNPVWPMPGCRETVNKLRDAGQVLGIVSNAQFYTPLMFPALVGESLSELGFAEELTYFSFEHLQAKPGVFLFQQVRAELAARGIAANEAAYVGNDMLNDIAAADSAGFRTALFAGDQRSLRMRDGDARVEGVEPDVTLSSLEQLADCLGLDG